MQFHVQFQLMITLVAALGILFPRAGDAESVDFGAYFQEGTLRVDIVHSGTRDEEAISLRRVLKEATWAGSKRNLIPSRIMGNYRLDLLSRRTGELIYREGFNCLFGEWQTTQEALSTPRAFEETLEMPLPMDSVELVLFRRNKKGEMEKSVSFSIDPAFHLIGAPSVGTPAMVIEFEINGRPENKVDLLILGDGYSVFEQEKFKADCRRFMDTFFDAEPFKRLRHQFNVRAVLAVSRESGIDEPRKRIYRDTPCGMTFNMFDLPRYCMTEAVWAIHDLASLAPHDAVLLVANSSRYGGGAIYNFYTVFVSDNEYDDYLSVHEFGHGFAGLGDEYYTSAVAYNEFYPPGIEPWEPNITALLDPKKLKWNRFVEAGTPIPTPEDAKRFGNKVGAFEGAGYAAKGLYRPAIDCKMFSKGNRAFCKVCEEAIVERIHHYAPE